MFEPFYDMTRTPFARDIPVTELYPAIAMEEMLDRPESRNLEMFKALYKKNG
jgi:hypothetical protein